ncbi:matrix protein [Sosuga virus]|uniref:Matrix protein n=1 Tax=Sosuga virus TaxID=1452514 RepID=W5S5I8_9MONO|nr:matrix protein [Sosuga virus]AHH02038.1 matrix protein [Sosuga virus]AVT50848.1 M [Expression vector pSOSV_FL-vc] [Expression vector pSOSV_FL-vc]
MAHRQATIPVHVDHHSEKNHLRAFPIVQADSPEGTEKGRLIKQMRFKDLTPRGSTEPPISFINTYGFIKPLRTREEFFSELHKQSQTPCLTACSIPFGAGPALDHPERLLDEIEKALIVVRKSASTSEECVFEIRKLPPMLTRHQLAGNKILCVPSDKYVKAPGKLTSGVDYAYHIVFISVTLCPPSQKFRVPMPVQSLRAKVMRSVHLEVMLKIDCDPGSPITKNLIYDSENDVWLASIWFHLCNLYKGHKPFKEYDDHHFAAKCRSMKLEVGIVDLWGPTFLVKSHGKIPHAARPFFGKHGWVCHPIMDCAPAICKSLWALSVSIVQVTAVLQASDLSQMVRMTDVIFPKIKVNPDLHGLGKSRWNPVTKIVSPE